MARTRPTLPPPWTVEEFLAWEREQEQRHEYVDGVIRLMAGGTLDHNMITGNVASGLRSQLRGGPFWVFAVAVKVVSGFAILYPDVVATRTPGPGQSDIVAEPEIVVEVLARSTQGFDRGPKLDAYQRIPSLEQYVLIAEDEIRVSVYEREDGSWRYRTLEDLDARLDFVAGDATLTLAEIYERATAAESATRPGG